MICTHAFAPISPPQINVTFSSGATSIPSGDDIVVGCLTKPRSQHRLEYARSNRELSRACDSFKTEWYKCLLPLPLTLYLHLRSIVIPTDKLLIATWSDLDNLWRLTIALIFCLAFQSLVCPPKVVPGMAVVQGAPFVHAMYRQLDSGTGAGAAGLIDHFYHDSLVMGKLQS